VLPNVLAGTIIGVLVLAIAPAWIVVVMVAGVMFLNAWKTSIRAVTDFKVQILKRQLDTRFTR